MNYIWISSFIFDVAFEWYYFKHSEFTLGKRRTWVKVLCAVMQLWLYLPGMFPVNTALLRVAYRLVIYFVWLWKGEGIPLRGALYTALFWTAVYTAFQNVFFGPFINGIASGRTDLFSPRLLSQIVVSILNIIVRVIYFGAVSRLLPLAGMIGANYSGMAFVILINIILTYSKIAIMPSNQTFSENQARMNTYYVLLQAALLLALIAFEYSRRSTVQAATLELQNVTGQALLASVKEKQQSEDAIRSLRHDLKNHNISVKLLLDKGDIRGAMSYLDSVSEALQKTTKRFHTENDLLDGLMLQKLSEPEKNGVKVTCSLDFSKAAELMDNFDLCVLMGNILDNAVEACAAMPEDAERFIKISGGQSANCQLIEVENSSVSKDDPSHQSYSSGPGQNVSNPLPLTTKSNKALHGFGLRNIKAVLERYNGTMDIERSEGTYSITLLIPMK